MPDNFLTISNTNGMFISMFVSLIELADIVFVKLYRLEDKNRPYLYGYIPSRYIKN